MKDNNEGRGRRSVYARRYTGGTRTLAFELGAGYCNPRHSGSIEHRRSKGQVVWKGTSADGAGPAGTIGAPERSLIEKASGERSWKVEICLSAETSLQ